MTIPPVSVRQVRPCYEYGNKSNNCIFNTSNEFGVFCLLHGYPQSDEDMDELIRPEKCESHFTKKEMQELIDQHNATENAVENYK